MAALGAALVMSLTGFGALASAATNHHTKRPHRAHPHRVHARTTGGLGQSSGLLPANKLTLKSAIQVNLNNDTVRLPVYPGTAPVPGQPGQTEKVWFILEDASDPGLANDLGVNYAPKLANIAISDPAAVQTVTLDSPSAQQNPFGPAGFTSRAPRTSARRDRRYLARTAFR